MIISQRLCTNRLSGFIKSRFTKTTLTWRITTFFKIFSVFVAWGCRYKIPQTGGLINGNLFLTALEAGPPRPGCRLIWCLVRLSSWPTGVSLSWLCPYLACLGCTGQEVVIQKKRGNTLMSLPINTTIQTSNPNYSPKAASPSTITSGNRVWLYGWGEGTQTFCPQQLQGWPNWNGRGLAPWAGKDVLWDRD